MTLGLAGRNEIRKIEQFPENDVIVVLSSWVELHGCTYTYISLQLEGCSHMQPGGLQRDRCLFSIRCLKA